LTSPKLTEPDSTSSPKCSMRIVRTVCYCRTCDWVVLAWACLTWIAIGVLGLARLTCWPGLARLDVSGAELEDQADTASFLQLNHVVAQGDIEINLDVDTLAANVTNLTGGRVAQGISSQGVAFAQQTLVAPCEGLEFIHIPKNAGTAIETAAKAVGVNWGHYHPTSNPACDFDPLWAIQNYPETHGGEYTCAFADGAFCSWNHMRPYDHPTPYNPFVNSDTFCVIRNPYERVVSEYKWGADRWWRIQGIGQSLHNQTNPLLFTSGSCAPQELNAWVQHAMRLPPEQRHFSANCHLLPETEYIWDSKGHQWCNHILKIENLNTEFEALMVDKGCPVRLPEKHTNEADACSDLSVNSLTPETRKLVYEVYREDFLRLGY